MLPDDRLEHLQALLAEHPIIDILHCNDGGTLFVCLCLWGIILVYEKIKN